MKIDAMSFYRLAKVLVDDAPVTARDACCAVRAARLAAYRHPETTDEHAAWDELISEICAGAGHSNRCAGMTLPQLVSELKTSEARELAYAIAYWHLVPDWPYAEIPLAELSRALGIDVQRANELVMLVDELAHDQLDTWHREDAFEGSRASH